MPCATRHPSERATRGPTRRLLSSLERRQATRDTVVSNELRKLVQTRAGDPPAWNNKTGATNCEEDKKGDTTKNAAVIIYLSTHFTACRKLVVQSLKVTMRG